MTYETFKKELLDMQQQYAIERIIYSDGVNRETATHIYNKLKEKYLKDKEYLI